MDIEQTKPDLSFLNEDLDDLYKDFLQKLKSFMKTNNMGKYSENMFCETPIMIFYGKIYVPILIQNYEFMILHYKREIMEVRVSNYSELCINLIEKRLNFSTHLINFVDRLFSNYYPEFCDIPNIKSIVYKE